MVLLVDRCPIHFLVFAIEAGKGLDESFRPFHRTSLPQITALEARLKQEGASSLRKPEEFFVSTDFFEERETVIPPDVTVAEDEDLGGMLFHVF